MKDIREIICKSDSSCVDLYTSLCEVWHCYILGNQKWLYSVPSESIYYEVTYDRDKGCYYVDKYRKENNTVIVE